MAAILEGEGRGKGGKRGEKWWGVINEGNRVEKFFAFMYFAQIHVIID